MTFRHLAVIPTDTGEGFTFPVPVRLVRAWTTHFSRRGTVLGDFKTSDEACAAIRAYEQKCGALVCDALAKVAS